MSDKIDKILVLILFAAYFIGIIFIPMESKQVFSSAMSTFVLLLILIELKSKSS